MKNIIIYHGSEQIIEKPELNYGSKFNDYGQGFYCTETEELAKEWACKRQSDGFANAYELNMNNLSVLDLEDDNHNALNWIAILLKHRTFRLDSQIAIQARDYIIDKFSPDTRGVDIIRGYRADDSYFRFAEAFVENTIPLVALNDALRLGNLGIQTAPMTRKAVEALTFTGAIPAERELYYPKFARRDAKAREDYRKLEIKRGARMDDIYIIDIIREEMNADDPRIQRSLLK